MNLTTQAMIAAMNEAGQRVLMCRLALQAYAERHNYCDDGLNDDLGCQHPEDPRCESFTELGDLMREMAAVEVAIVAIGLRLIPKDVAERMETP